jgi:putative transposase
MPTECSADLFGFTAVEGRAVVAAFDGGLITSVGEAHRRTTSFIHARGRWTGHLSQSRFSSVMMDEGHLIATARCVSLNPVQARLARKAEDWAWSSGRAQLLRDDEFVSVASVLNLIDRFATLLESDADDGAFGALRSSEGSGRPLGNADFIADLERCRGGLSLGTRASEILSAQPRSNRIC